MVIVGAGTSKANTAILHTGFNAKPGSLKAGLVRRGCELPAQYASRTGSRSSARAPCSSLGTRSSGRAAAERSRPNGYPAIRELDAAELYRHEPHLGPGAVAALEVPDEAIVCPFTTPLSFATEAVEAGCELRRSTRVVGVERTPGGGFRVRTSGDRLPAPGEGGRPAQRRGRPHAQLRRLHGHLAAGRADRVRQALAGRSSTTSSWRCPRRCRRACSGRPPSSAT